VEPLMQPAPIATAAAHTTAMQLLDRYGVVTREAVLAEGVVGGYASVYGVLKVLEERGQTRRGYFVSGLGAAQFGLPGAVDRLRSARETADADLHPDERPDPVVLAATDPAQPYGAAIGWPDTAGRPARAAGALVVLRAGEPLVWFDRRSHHVVTFPAAAVDDGWTRAVVSWTKDGRARSVEVRKVDGEPVLPASAVAESLRSAGFVEGYRGWVFRP
jgi:ATP-dependent Lhr-like helicase